MDLTQLVNMEVENRASRVHKEALDHLMEIAVHLITDSLSYRADKDA